MTRDQLFSFMEELDKEAIAVMRRKSADYAAGDDPFRNFRQFGTFGILVRLSDKLARLQSFEQTGVFRVEDEKLRDTVIDLKNYCGLYLALHEEQKKST
jgi:hypothetical protein